MRLLATIIAVVMSVTTGGPLRCPCQLAALVRGTTCVAETVQVDPATFETHTCCCQSHREPEEPQPTEREPSPGEPCPHGPSVDLVLPTAGGERHAGGGGLGDFPVAAHGAVEIPLYCGLNLQLFVVCEPTSSKSDRLRYCHSFRC